jgi:hypothetical protein
MGLTTHHSVSLQSGTAWIFSAAWQLLIIGAWMLVPPAASQTIDRSKLVDLTSRTGGPAPAVLP